jgi:hypothetical protein
MQGFASLFTALANAAGLETVTCHGVSDYWGGCYWNIVNLNGNWYNVGTSIMGMYLGKNAAAYTNVSDGVICDVGDTYKGYVPVCEYNYDRDNPYVHVLEVKLSQTEVRLNLDGKEQISLTAEVLPDNADDKSITWRSSNTGVATVDPEGTVTAVAPGTAIITCSSVESRKSADCTVTVSSVTTGDVNDDNSIDLYDLMLVLNHVSNKTSLTGNSLSAADVDGDGDVDLMDLMRLLNYVSGKSKTL